MANDLISRKALIDDLRSAKGLGLIIAETLVRFLKKQPTVDAVEVVHGRWEFDCACEPYCSVCGEYALQLGFEKHASNYCPNCGADMRGTEE